MYNYDEWDDTKEKLARDEVWTPQMVAERWSVKPRTVMDMLTRGELKGFKVRQNWRVYLSEILRYEGQDPKSKEHLRPQAVAPMPQPVVMRIS